MSKPKKTILISGASTGIGRAAAHHLAAQGHLVFAGVRKTSVTFDDPKIIPLLLDVESTESMQAAMKTVHETTGGSLDCLINNAGIAYLGPLEGIGLAALKKQYDVNVFGLYELTRLFLPMIKHAQGRIVNMSSVSGLFSTAYTGPYCSSKYAVESLSDVWRCELSKFGIKVILVEPGPIQTEIWSKSEWFWDGSLEATHKQELQNAYAVEKRAFDRIFKGVVKGAKSTQLVNQALDKAIQKRFPAARYVVNGNGFVLRLLRFLPEWLVDALFLRTIKKFGSEHQSRPTGQRG